MLLPNLVTTGALTLGFWSITQSVHGRFGSASWAIIMAGVLDTLDGRIARATDSTTRFGVEYDSLVDVICYGVAPALLVYAWALEPLLGARAWPLGALFTICAALRLARFNAQADVPRDHYVGIPSTAAGAVVTLTDWFVDWLGVSPGDSKLAGALLAAGFVALALLMVSPVPYPSWKSIPIMRRHAFPSLVAVVLTLLLVLVNGEPALFLLALMYLGSGPTLQWWMARQSARAPQVQLEALAAEPAPEPEG
jgi:CDP-diacylglycerol--serine O-phosphatidyltransferase